MFDILEKEKLKMKQMCFYGPIIFKFTGMTHNLLVVMTKLGIVAKVENTKIRITEKKMG